MCVCVCVYEYFTYRSDLYINVKSLAPLRGHTYQKEVGRLIKTSTVFLVLCLLTSLSVYTSLFRHTCSILSHDPSLFFHREHLRGLTHLCEHSVFGRLLSWWLVRYLTVEGRLIGSAKVDHPQGSMWKTSLCQEPQPNLFRPVWRPSSKLWLSVLYLFFLSLFTYACLRCMDWVSFSLYNLTSCS